MRVIYHSCRNLTKPQMRLFLCGLGRGGRGRIC